MPSACYTVGRHAPVTRPHVQIWKDFVKVSSNYEFLALQTAHDRPTYLQKRNLTAVNLLLFSRTLHLGTEAQRQAHPTL